jgi:hypothetical protein
VSKEQDKAENTAATFEAPNEVTFFIKQMDTER